MNMVPEVWAQQAAEHLKKVVWKETLAAILEEAGRCEHCGKRIRDMEVVDTELCYVCRMGYGSAANDLNRGNDWL